MSRTPPKIPRTTAKGESLAEEASFAITVKAKVPGRIGPVLDFLTNRISEVQDTWHDEAEIFVEGPEGWTDTWYGYERDEHALDRKR